MFTFVAALILFIVVISLWYLFNGKPAITCKPSSIPYENRDYIEYNDLLDPRIRADPHRFNQHIYNNIILKSNDIAIKNGIIPVHGEKNTFLICKYNAIREILANEKVYSSNPFPDHRLIAPNAMDDEQHKVIMKYLKKYYSASTVSRQIPMIEKIIRNIVENFIHRQKINEQIDKKHKTETLGIDAMNALSKIIVMRTALFMLGLPSKQYNNFKIVNKLITFNDQIIKLIAPQGGIGYKIQFSFTQLINVIFGLLFAMIPTIRLILKIGIMNTWDLLRPDLNIFKLPNIDKDNGTPRPQIWVYPHILYAVPQHFLYLNDLYETYGVKLLYPNISKETNIIDGRNVFQSLYDGEVNGDLTRSEILATIVQLMVNMTTANAIANMLYRISTKGLNLKQYLCDNHGKYDENIGDRLIEEVLRSDASLQRLPRRSRFDVNDFYGQKFPKNSNLLLMIGIGNNDKDIFGDKAFEFIPDRYLDKKEEIAKRLTFGYGIHLCLGYLLVKREMNITLKTLIHCNVNKIIYKSSQRLTNIDVGNYGFNKLFLRFDHQYD